MAKGKWFNETAEDKVEEVFKEQGGHIWFVTFKQYKKDAKTGESLPPTKAWFVGNKIPKEYKDKENVKFELVK